MDAEPWSIGISHPRHPETAIATARLRAGAVATSGDYERFMEIDGIRYCHLLNPRTGWPVRGLQSVSILADTCLAAGTLATIAMLKETGGEAWLRSLGTNYLCVDGERGCTASDMAVFRPSD